MVEDLQLEQAKTKEFNTILMNLKVSDKKSLVVVAEQNKSLYLSSRNLKNTKVVSASDLNTYDLMNASVVVLVEGALEKLEAVLS